MGSVSRQDIALDEPGDRDLRGLPPRTLQPEQFLYRAHRQDLSPWWYASDADGRFNLSEPHGTCYLAHNEATAVREVAGESLARGGVITADFAAERVVSTLNPPPGTSLLADLTDSAAATVGLTREIHTCVPYELPRRWAAAIRAHGFDGIVYLARFSTGVDDLALAVFGAAGQADHPVDPAPRPLTAVAAAHGFRVASRPRSVTVVSPPPRPRGGP